MVEHSSHRAPNEAGISLGTQPVVDASNEGRTVTQRTLGALVVPTDSTRQVADRPEPRIPSRVRRGLLATGAAFAVGASSAACAPASEVPAAAPVPSISAVPTENACAPDGNPTTANEIYCEPRRHAKLEVVVVPDLPADGFTHHIDHATAEAAAAKATKVLETVSDGQIKLTPEVIDAPAGLADAVKKENRGFHNGHNCVDIEDDGHRMSEVVTRLHPELLRESAQVMVIGGQSCRVSWLPNGGDTAGIAHFNVNLQVADVFTNAQQEPGISVNIYTPIDRLAGVIAHEEGHNFGLGHEGYASYKDFTSELHLERDPQQPVDIEALFRRINGYDDAGALGKLMSKNPSGLTGRPDVDKGELTDPIEENYIYGHSVPVPDARDSAAFNRYEDARPLKFVLGDEKVTVQKDSAAEPKAIETGLGAYPQLGAYQFENMVLTPVFLKNETQVNLSLTEGSDTPFLPVADLGTFSLRPGVGRVFTTQEYEITVTKDPNQEAVELSVKAKR